MKKTLSKITFLTLLLIVSAALAPAAAAQVVALECRIQYGKSVDLSHRSADLISENGKLMQVLIDGQPAYTFTLSDNKLVTSMDSERIYIEFQGDRTLWRSNFRDKDFGAGVCIKRAQVNAPR